MKERVTKREKISRVDIYTSRIIIIQNKVIFKDFPPPPFLGQYMKNGMHLTNGQYREIPTTPEHKIQICGERGIITKLKLYMKEEISNRLALLESGSYCTAARFPSINFFAPDHCICYRSQHSLLLTTSPIITTRFFVLTKSISKYRQLAPLVDDDLTNTRSY